MIGKRLAGIVFLAVCVGVVVFWASWGEKMQISGPHYEVAGIVQSVVDGDTIVVKVENVLPGVDPAGGEEEGNSEHVRFGGGIDAPETWTDPPENGAYEAKEFIENLLPVGTVVRLDLNGVQSSDYGIYRDHYGRLVAVIYVESGGQWVNVNAELLRWGLEYFPGNDWLEYANLPSEWDPVEWLAEGYPYVSGRW